MSNPSIDGVLYVEVSQTPPVAGGQRKARVGSAQITGPKTLQLFLERIWIEGAWKSLGSPFLSTLELTQTVGDLARRWRNPGHAIVINHSAAFVFEGDHHRIALERRGTAEPRWSLERCRDAEVGLWVEVLRTDQPHLLQHVLELRYLPDDVVALMRQAGGGQ